MSDENVIQETEEVVYEANVENVTEVAQAILGILDEFPDTPVLDILTALRAVESHIASASGIIAMLAGEEE